MARISVVGNPFNHLLLWDLDKVQLLREHTVHPPGQERYIKPIDEKAVQAILDAHDGGNGTTEDAAVLIADTVGVDDISAAAIQAAITETLTAGEIEAIQEAISYSFVETGNFMLSFNGGVIAKAIELGWIKVFTNDGDDLYSL